MDTCLKLHVFDTAANAVGSSRKWKHWKRTFVSYTARLANISVADKLAILVNLVDTSVYAYISECTTYADAIGKLDEAYIKRVNEVYARYQLSTCRQSIVESLEEYLQKLKVLSTDCNFRDGTAAQQQEAAIRDAFIADMHSSCIRQRLLEGND